MVLGVVDVISQTTDTNYARQIINAANLSGYTPTNGKIVEKPSRASVRFKLVPTEPTP